MDERVIKILEILNRKGVGIGVDISGIINLMFLIPEYEDGNHERFDEFNKSLSALIGFLRLLGEYAGVAVDNSRYPGFYTKPTVWFDEPLMAYLNKNGVAYLQDHYKIERDIALQKSINDTNKSVIKTNRIQRIFIWISIVGLILSTGFGIASFYKNDPPCRLLIDTSQQHKPLLPTMQPQIPKAKLHSPPSLALKTLKKDS